MTLQSMIDYTKFVCSECQGKDDRCQSCCPHSEYDHGLCLDCDKDCTDDLAGAAEAYFEGDR